MEDLRVDTNCVKETQYICYIGMCVVHDIGMRVVLDIGMCVVLDIGMFVVQSGEDS